MILICAQCHAKVHLSAKLSACPACDGALVPHRDLDQADAPERVADHRGILLPLRHAVGGIITPR